MVATPEGTTLRRYWAPEAARTISLASDDAYLEAFLDVFGRAVRDRLRSVTPVAIMISAGLDSSSVAAVAARELRPSGRRLLALHSAPRTGFDGEAQPGWVQDESADVQALAAMHENIDLIIVRGQDGTPLDDADRLFGALGAPVRNSISLSWIRMLYERAAARGAGVMLNGGKGNFTISYTGLRAILDLARGGRLVTALREVRAVAQRRGHRARDVLKYQIIEPLLPRPVHALRQRFRRGPGEAIQEQRYSAIRPEFAVAMRIEERAIELQEDDVSLSRSSAREYRIMGLTASGDSYDAYHGLRSWFPVETREVPTDIRVVDFCLGIPTTQYLRNGHDRQLIRRGMRDLLPESIRQRTTRGAQAADWPDWFGGMRAGMAAELDRLERNETARRCLDLSRMRRLVDAWPAAFGPQHTGDYALLLLRGIMMGRFIRWFEERRS
jgi:asparagine synthase (glutamine-hydrolysing)